MRVDVTSRTATRRRVLLGAAGVAALGAAGCAQGGGGQEAAQLTSVKERATLEMWHWDAFFKDTMVSFGEGFTKLNPNATVSVLQIPLGDYYGTKLPAAIASDTAPAVVGVHPEYSHSTAAGGFYKDLGKYIAADKSFDKNDFFDVGLKAYSWKGVQ